MLADYLCHFLPGKFWGLNYSLLEILPKNTFQSKRSCVSGQYQTAEQSDQIRFTVVRGKNPYFYCLSSVSLSIFSLQTSRPLFDCSRIFENAKIWTVLQSRPVFGQNEPKLPKDLLSLKPATKKCMLFADLHQDLHNHFCPFRKSSALLSASG